MSASRETARDNLASLLETALVGSGLPVKTVTASNVKKLDGKTPLVAILSSGTLRERMTFMGDHPTFYLDVQVWVLAEGTGWTTAEAEDALDRIESIIAGVYDDNRGTDQWSVLEYSGRTVVSEITVDGRRYLFERIPTTVQTVKE